MQNKRYVILAVGGITTSVTVAVILGVFLTQGSDESAEEPSNLKEMAESQDSRPIQAGPDTPSSDPQSFPVQEDLQDTTGAPDSPLGKEISRSIRKVMSLYEDSQFDQIEQELSRLQMLSEEEAMEALRVALRVETTIDPMGRDVAIVVIEAGFIHRLMNKLSDAQILDVVLEDFKPAEEPSLMQRTDKHWASDVYENVIEMLVGRTRTSGDPLVALRHYLEDRKDTPPWNLIEWMYLEYSGLALKTVGALYLNDEELSSLVTELDALGSDSKYMEYLRGDKAKKIAMFMPLVKRCAEHDEWSVRVYAAAAIQARPELRTPELLRRLGNDKVEVVRKIIRKISEEEAPEGRFD